MKAIRKTLGFLIITIGCIIFIAGIAYFFDEHEPIGALFLLVVGGVSSWGGYKVWPKKALELKSSLEKDPLEKTTAPTPLLNSNETSFNDEFIEERIQAIPQVIQQMLDDGGVIQAPENLIKILGEKLDLTKSLALVNSDNLNEVLGANRSLKNVNKIVNVENHLAVNVEFIHYFESRDARVETRIITESSGPEYAPEDIWHQHVNYQDNKKKYEIEREGSSRWVGCPQCHESGCVTCSKCSGKGEIAKNCQKCSGTGTIKRLDKMVGIGKQGAGGGLIERKEQCLQCNGGGKIMISCPKCSGSGTESCGECKGSGKVEEYEAISIQVTTVPKAATIRTSDQFKDKWLSKHLEELSASEVEIPDPGSNNYNAFINANSGHGKLMRRIWVIIIVGYTVINYVEKKKNKSTILVNKKANKRFGF